MTLREDSRTANLLAAGASSEECGELLRYAENKFRLPPILPQFPLADEPFAETWREYAAAHNFLSLQLKLVQLAFPVEAGMSEMPAYQAATRRGDIPVEAVRGGAVLHSPETCEVIVHDSFAGGIGVITARDRSDFETLVRVFTARNEPIVVRPSMGATIVSGYNNWHRIQVHKQKFLAGGGNSWEWSTEFSRFKLNKDNYQDRFIVLSNGPYSGVAAASLGLDPEEWIAQSRAIRLEHEYAHYFTRRVFGSMQNNLLDEMMADYAGLRGAFGSFRAEWLLRFLGLEAYPRYREGGRLQNYRGTPPLSDGAFALLMRVVRQAAANLENFDRNRPPGRCLPADLMAIASLSLDDLAAPDAPRLLAERCPAEADRLAAAQGMQ